MHKAVLGALCLIILASAGEAADLATAELIGAEGQSLGQISLADTPNGVLLNGRLHGLAPGPHAIHFHAVGRCEPPFDSAGGHFNPDGKLHGFLSEAGPHAGDLPNMHVPEGGALEFEMLAPAVTLRPSEPNALLDADGASIVIHDGADDYKTDPAGGSGSRIACGVVRR